MRVGSDSYRRGAIGGGVAVALSAGVFAACAIVVAGKHGSAAGAVVRDTPVLGSVIGMTGHSHRHRTFEVYGVPDDNFRSLSLFDDYEDARTKAIDSGATVVRYACRLHAKDAGVWAETTRHFTAEVGARNVDRDAGIDLAADRGPHDPAIARLLSEIEPFADRYGMDRPTTGMLNPVPAATYPASPEASVSVNMDRPLYGGYALNVVSALSAIVAILGIGLLAARARRGKQE